MRASIEDIPQGYGLISLPGVMQAADAKKKAGSEYIVALLAETSAEWQISAQAAFAAGLTFAFQVYEPGYDSGQHGGPKPYFTQHIPVSPGSSRYKSETCDIECFRAQVGLGPRRIHLKADDEHTAAPRGSLGRYIRASPSAPIYFEAGGRRFSVPAGNCSCG